MFGQPKNAHIPTKELDDWDPESDDPLALIGVPIWVSWAGGKWYRGIVDQYNPATGEHHVFYDDGDQKWYRMLEKTFRVDGNQHIHHARFDIVRELPFIPYIPKDPNARFECSFHLVIDPNVLDLAHGEQVGLRGTLPQMGEWNHTVPMIMSNGNPALWSVTLELPFLANESCQSGLFEFKFVIERDGEVIMEQGSNRREKTVCPHYYCHFRPDKSNQKFKNYEKHKKNACLNAFLENEVLNCFEGRITPSDFTRRCIALSSDYEARRSHFEECFDRFLPAPYRNEKEKDNNLPDICQRLDFVLGLLAAIGSFGLSSADQIENDGNVWQVVGEKQKPPRPAPRPWCNFICNELPIDLLMKRNLQNELGVQTCLHLMTGIKEAMERISLDQRFEWLSLTPLIKQFSSLPNPVQILSAAVERKKGASLLKKREENFLLRGVEQVLASFTQYLQKASEEQQAEKENQSAFQQADQQSTSSSSLSSSSLSTSSPSQPALSSLPAFPSKQQTEPFYIRLARDLLKCLVVYAPSLACLIQLFDNETVKQHALWLRSEVNDWLRSFPFQDHSELNLLNKLLLSNPDLVSPQAALALLSNKSTDDDIGFTKDVVAQNTRMVEEMVQLCLLCFSLPQSASSSSTLSSEVKSNQETPAIEEKLNHDLEVAVKNWIFRNFSVDFVTQQEEKQREQQQNNNNWGFWNPLAFGNINNKKQVQTDPRVLFERRVKAFARACDVVELFLNIPFLQSRPQGLLFELTRCFFFKGDPQVVLQALCSLAVSNIKKDKSGSSLFAGFAQYGPALRSFLTARGCRLIEDLFPILSASSVSNPDDSPITSLIDMLIQELPKSLDVFNSFMLAACNSTQLGNPPRLSSIIQHQVFFTRLLTEKIGIRFLAPNNDYKDKDKSKDFITVEPDMSRQANELQSLIDSVCQLLLNTEKDILSGHVKLHLLSSVNQNSQVFLNLLQHAAMYLRNSPSISLSPVVLKTKIAQWRTFDSTLSELRCFVSFYAQGGVRMNVSELSAEVASLTKNYDQLTLATIEDAFLSVLKKTNGSGSFSWLYSLRNSSLFLQLWRQIAQGYLNDEFSEEDDAKLFSFVSKKEKPKEKKSSVPDAPPLSGLFGSLFSESKHEEKKPLSSSSSSSAEEKSLSQDLILCRMIPRAKTMWKAFHDSLKLKTIGVHELQQTFGVVCSTEQEIFAELNICAITGEGEAPSPSSPLASWVQDTLKSMRDYLFLTSLKNFLPAVLHLRQLLASHLFSASSQKEDSDATAIELRKLHSILSTHWQNKTLATLPELLQPIESFPLLRSLSTLQMNFLTLLSSHDGLLNWLLAHRDTNEFNRLLQVVRPCIDEPRLLSALASLVHIRTLLLPLLSRPADQEGFSSLQEALSAFHTTVRLSEGENDDLRQLGNIQSSFEALVDVMEKQTRSPGIAAFFNLRDIAANGTFVLTTHMDRTKCLVLELSEKQEEKEEKDELSPPKLVRSSSSRSSSVRKVECLDYLLDLRSKLLMTEIPPEMEQGMGISAQVDDFILQLQALLEIADIGLSLTTAGHPSYVPGTLVLRHRFSRGLEGAKPLDEKLLSLKQEVEQWNMLVKRVREQFYFLNFFTMRELIQLSELLDASNKKEPSISNSQKGPEPISSSENESKSESKSAAVPQLPKEWSCPLCTFNNPSSARKCEMCESDPPQSFLEILNAVSNLSSPKPSRPSPSAALQPRPENPSHHQKIVDLLHLVSSSIDLPVAFVAISQWPNIIEEETQLKAEFDNYHCASPASEETSQRDPSVVLAALGRFLAVVFGTRSSASEASQFENALFSAMSAPAVSSSLQKQIEHNFKRTLLYSVAFRKAQYEIPETEVTSSASLSSAPFALSSKFAVSHLTALPALAPTIRSIPPPEATAQNRSDLLVAIQSSDDAKTKSAFNDESSRRELPIWVATANSPAHVIEVVFSVFVRRARLPEPSEILFCTDETTFEDVNLLLYRFIHARSANRQQSVFVIADLHALSYTLQCAVVDQLKALLAEHGTKNAASLLFVSGKPRQFIINAFSASSIDLPPLDEKSLRTAIARACNVHCGETLAVYSDINGGGKTHFILRSVGDRQKMGEQLLYRRVPYREASSASTLIRALSKFPKTQRNAIHLDIGCIIPPCSNTNLFELLIVGVIKGSMTVQSEQDLQGSSGSLVAVYARNKADVIYVEIPNSRGEKTAQALRFCQLLPCQRLVVAPDTLDLRRPIFTNPECTRISSPENSEMTFVCKFLRAYRRGKFLPKGPNFDPDWDVWTEPEVTPQECFELLSSYCSDDGQPSFLVLNSFLQFMNASFGGMQQYPVFDTVVLQNSPGLEALKDVFSRLLIETNRDFALRQVPRGNQFGQIKRQVVTDYHDPSSQQQQQQNNNSLVPPPVPALVRSASAEWQDRMQHQEVPQLVRELSEDIAERFANIKTWESTEHPICLFYTSSRGQYVEGLDILSLNPRFLDRFIKNDMKMALMHNKIELDKDWRDLKSEQAIEIIRKVEGFQLGGGAAKFGIEDLDPTYVITIDNLLKMLSIQLRLKNNVPVIIMGESGCGKSSLIRQLCAILRYPLRTLNIHGGLTDEDIISWMKARIYEAHQLRQYESLVVFLDEINTTNSMSLFKEIVCDRSMEGQMLPANLKIIAACNPYRKKKGLLAIENRMAGLVFDQFSSSSSYQLGENIGTGISDPLSQLVYRVHPLPESMTDYVFDFGALPPEVEKLYIKAMIRKQLAMFVLDEEKEEKVSPQASASLSSSSQQSDSYSQASSRSPAQQSRMGALAAQLREMMRRRQGDNNRPRNNSDADNYHHRYRRHSEEDLERVYDENGNLISGPPLTDRPEDDPSYQLALRLSAAENNEAELAKLQQELYEGRWGRQSDFGEFVDVFAELICSAQEYVRAINSNERSVVSLRDVARCIKVYRWFGESFHKGLDSAEKKSVDWTLDEFFAAKPKAQKHVRKAVILSLAYCYHARLPREHRSGFRAQLAETYRSLKDNFFGMNIYFGGRQKADWLKLTAENFHSTLNEVQLSFVSRMKTPDGIALNEALLENLFMLLVSIFTQTPIYVVGKPGSSKSLAMSLLQQNMNGQSSDTHFARQLPAIEVFSYQCSPLSTSQGIESVFEQAERYKAESPAAAVVVLLDEVGLAEQSPHLPLKVLHKLLDETHNVSVVGISNWALDPAKMNRAVHLFRPAPTVEDLRLTAENMVKSANLKGYLTAIAKSYHAVYSRETNQDFHGLRDFYSCVKHINRALHNSSSTVDSALILDAVLRNFGGKETEMQLILDTFFSNLGFSRENLKLPGPLELIKANLASPEARHLMLLTKNNAAMSILFDRSILSHTKTEVIFGSDFPADRSDLTIMLNLQRIKLCMQQEMTVVLINCESLYESLYDLLNQHYVNYNNQLFVQIAFGSHSRLCLIHKSFRIIVICDKHDAYNRLAPPLLNRFEKHCLERVHILTPAHCSLIRKVKSFLAAMLGVEKDSKLEELARRELEFLKSSSVLASDSADPKARDRISLKLLRNLLTGFHPEMLSSLAHAVFDLYYQDRPAPAELPESDLEALFILAVERLLWLATPEAICRVLARRVEISSAATSATSLTAMKKKRIFKSVSQILQEEFNVDLMKVYFDQQHHSDLVTFIESSLQSFADETWNKEMQLKQKEQQQQQQQQQQQSNNSEQEQQQSESAPLSLVPVGCLSLVATYAPLSLSITETLKQQKTYTNIDVCALHELSSERDFSAKVEDFFEAVDEDSNNNNNDSATAASARWLNDGKVLIVQCDPLAASYQRIQHAKYMAERAMERWILAKREGKKATASATSSITFGLSKKEEKSVVSSSSSLSASFDGKYDEKVADEKDQKQTDEKEESKATAATTEDDNKEYDSKEDDSKEVDNKENDNTSASSTAIQQTNEPFAFRPRGVHIIFVIHLPRNDSSFVLDFDNRWKYVYVDSIQPAKAEGLPPLQTLMLLLASQQAQGRNHHQTRALLLDKLDLQQLLLRCFRISLSRLVFHYPRNNEDVKKQISFLLQRLQGDADFLSLIKDSIRAMVDARGKYEEENNLQDDEANNKQYDLLSAAQEESSLSISGTFQAALVSQISSSIADDFSLLLSHADRNQQLYLLNDEADTDGSIRKLWLYLFKRSLVDMNANNLALLAASNAAQQQQLNRQMQAQRRIDVINDGLKAAFSSRFPFSFFIHHVLVSLRPSVEKLIVAANQTDVQQDAQHIDSPSQKIELALQQQFSLLHWEILGQHVLHPAAMPVSSSSSVLSSPAKGEKEGSVTVPLSVDGLLSQQLLHRYIYDLVCQVSSPLRFVTREVQAELLWQLLLLADIKNPLQRLSALEARFFLVESRFHIYSSLLEALQSQHMQEIVLSLLKEKVANASILSSVKLDLLVTEALLKELLAQEGLFADVEDYLQWLSKVERARTFFLALLTGARKSYKLLESSSSSLSPNPGLAAFKQDLEHNVFIWVKVTFDFTFLKEVAVPLAVEPGLVTPLLQQIKSGDSVRTNSTLRLILRLLSQLNRAYSRQRDENDELNECELCFAIPHEPVRSCTRPNCLRLLCKSCVENYLASSNFKENKCCFYCRQPLKVEPSKPGKGCYVAAKEEDVELTLKATEKEQQLQAAAVRFFELFLFSFCLPPFVSEQEEQSTASPSSYSVFSVLLDTSTETLLINDLFTLLAGRALDLGSNEVNTINIAPSEAARISLMRALLLLREPSAQEQVQKLLTQELLLQSERLQALDTPLAVVYVYVIEDLLSTTGLPASLLALPSAGTLRLPPLSSLPSDASRDMINSYIQSLAQIVNQYQLLKYVHSELPSKFLASAQDFPIREILQSVAITRRLLVLFADLICNVEDKPLVNIFMKPLIDEVDRLLTHEEPLAQYPNLTPSLPASNSKPAESVSSPPSSNKKPASSSKTVSSFFSSIFGSSKEPKESKEASSSSSIHKEPVVQSSPQAVATALKAAFTVVRSLRLFLLRQLEHKRGLGFVRALLLQPPFSNSVWLRQWKESGEVGLIRFIGANKLPRANPFIALPLFNEVAAALNAGLAPSALDFSVLTAVLTQQQQNETKRGVLRAALLAALFHECFLLSVLPEVPASTMRRISELQSWLAASPIIRSLFAGQFEYALMLFFSGIKSASSAVLSSSAAQQPNHAALQFFQLSHQSSTEQIVHARLVCHFVIACVACATSERNDQKHPFQFFRTLLTDPQRLAQSFFPVGPEDVTAMAVKVLGGRWYRCSNGHAYYVDQCGRPTVIQKCATCGVQIGGLNHDLLRGQRDLDEKLEGNTGYHQRTQAADRSEKGYCSRSAEEEKDVFLIERGMPPIVCRAMRWMIHAALSLGACLRGEEYVQRAKPIFNTSYSQPADLFAFSSHVIGHLQQDFQIISQLLKKNQEETSLLLHLALAKLTDQLVASPSSASLSSASAILLNFDANLLPTNDIRIAWEQKVSKELILPFLSTTSKNANEELAERIQAANSKFGPANKKDDSSAFVSELQERIPVASMDKAIRQSLAPSLWLHRTPFSLMDMLMELQMLGQSAENHPYPLLLEFLTEEPRLRALRFLPQVLEWQNLLLTKFNRAIDKEAARSLTVRETLQLVPEHERPRWHQAFKGYANAWSLAWQFVERFGCMQIPAMYKNVEQNENTPIVFSLPSEKDEGICPLTLLRFLGEQHNRFLERAHERQLMLMKEPANKKARKHDTSQNEETRLISSRFFTEANALTYDLEAFSGFVEKQCMKYSSSTLARSVRYDFKTAEQFLLDFFANKAQIEMEVRMIVFSETASLASNLATQLQLLRQKVRQEPLPRDLETSLQKDLSNAAAARSLLENLEIVVCLLQSTGGSVVQKLDDEVGEKLLCEYASAVLLMEKEQFVSITPALAHVKLKHLEQVFKLARDILSQANGKGRQGFEEALASVSQKYNERLDRASSQVTELKAAAEKMDKAVLIPLMKDFILSQLTEEHIKPTESIASVLGFVLLEDRDMYLSDVDWFAAFPATLMMKNIVDVLTIIEESAV